MRIYRIDRFPGVRGMGDVFLLGILYTMFLKKGTDKTRNGTKDTTLTCIKIGKGSDRGLLLYLICLMTGADKTRNDTKDTTTTYIHIKIGKGRDRSLLVLIQLYYFPLVLLIGCMPGKLGSGNWFHAQGPVSLLAAARSWSDGATCDLSFSGGYL